MRKRVKGITLTEVVIGIALLGSLLTLLLMGASRLLLQRKLALQKLAAVEELDKLAHTFYTKGFPNLGDQQPIARHPEWFWTLQQMESQVLHPSVMVVRLEIQTPSRLATSGVENRPWHSLAGLDLVIAPNKLGKLVVQP